MDATMPPEPHCPRYNELPALSLYLDQVLIITNDSLRPFVLDESGVITGTMVNNYVKMKLIAHSKKKKYDRDQIAQLIMISSLKRVLSMTEIALVLEWSSAFYGSIEAYYDRFCDCLEEKTDESHDNKGPSSSDAALLPAAVKTLVDKLVFEKIAAAHPTSI